MAGHEQAPAQPLDSRVLAHQWATDLVLGGDIDAVRAALAAPPNADAEARRLLIRLLAAAPGDHGPWVGLLSEVARTDGDGLARRAAVRALGERHGEAPARALSELAADAAVADLAQLLAVVEALSQQDHPVAVQALRELASKAPRTHDDASLEFAARTVAALRTVLSRSARAAVEGGATGAAISATPQAEAAVSALGEILRSPAAPETHRLAAQALVSAKAPSALDALVSVAGDSGVQVPVRRLAVRALAELDDTRAIAALSDLAVLPGPRPIRQDARALLAERRRIVFPPEAEPPAEPDPLTTALHPTGLPEPPRPEPR
ncbi:MAG: HEAT repeat domain-containing protein [Planctomycetes bacterium]|nr:HEAT repeat domain-containing protein [Planctomycetota bacterium]